MKDFYLKAPTKQAFIDDLKDLSIMVLNKRTNQEEDTLIGFVTQDEEGNDVLANTGRGFALDYVGKIVITPGTYDEEGVELTAPEFTDEVHANLRIFSIARKVGSVHKVYDDTEEKIEEVLINATFANGTVILEGAEIPDTPVRVFA